MATVLLLGVFVICVAAVWFQGLWGATITLINTLLAAMIATNNFEWVAALVVENLPDARFHADFACLWLTFFVAFFGLRLVSDLMTGYRVKFNKWLELAGRSVMAVWVAWLLVTFVSFTMLTLPAGANAMGLQDSPQSGVGLFSPTRKWLGFVYSRSRSSLSRNPFDPQADFLLRYRALREDFDKQ